MTTPATLKKHLAEFMAMVEDGALVAINHSGGKDSQATYAIIRALVPHDQIITIHADLGDVEWPGVKDHIRANIGHDLVISKAIYKDGSPKGLLDMVERRGMWPSSGQRYCTSDLKRGPCNRDIRRIAVERGCKTIISCFGFRAEESAARAKRPTWELNKRMSKAGRTWIDFSPIHDLTIEQVWAVIDGDGQARHWAYDLGMSRLSCCFCIMGNTADMGIAAQHNPDLFKRYVALERRLGHTMRNGKPLKDIPTQVRNPKTELTDVGEQYVIPGAEKPPVKEGQGELW